MTVKKALMMAGGTGGHVFPALAVAAELQKDGWQVEWLGTAAGIEKDLVPANQIPLHTIAIKGLRGKGFAGLLLAPFKVARAVWQAKKIIKQINPDVVLGFGGYVTGPGGVAAKMLGIPLLVHEQNARAGMTNKLLSRLADCVMQAFPGAIDGAITTGNPVRRDVVELPDPVSRYGERRDNKVLNVLIIGGSQGAVAVNNAVFDAMDMLPGHERPRLRQQAGKNNYEKVSADYRDAGIEAEILPFIDDMAAAYAWADMLVCRAGALTVSEVAAAGCAAIFIPLPSAVDDHQTANARYLSDNKAALLCPQKELTPEWLAEQWVSFAEEREELTDIAVKARELAMTDAAEKVAEQVKRFVRD
ncbi:MAG: undecaprenyldiphospho-muramoylpentapeptide beta-N-acetylglucosaminyltransferase [Oceanospirillaceae bacterium]|nr:undecaprenyldiphospho-muramoylpentapeptide beta-N-acetylglucosaminyltransferase [Oceanospirillaceae bacterium]MBT11301.1 undecaprenyldiphospho-muramoylpentapeptide beta-N-acetylglucosaminyltransferase [Oceanospirillaceae bacterium]|tara:strand:+ start:95050 stop:96129 length:1080 start_codon:yes stop_codon:yes gene_type:complete